MADWIGINSTHLDSFCGESGGFTLAEALDGTDWWNHSTNHIHWFIIDLGTSINVQKVKGRSDVALLNPSDVNIYVSNDTGDWGAAVATGITTWKNTSNWVEVDSTDKEGRYVKVEIIDTEDFNELHELGWGRVISPFIIFDVYGEVVPENAIFMGANF